MLRDKLNLALSRLQNMLSVSDIREALRACFTSANPYNKPLNIVDLGLLHDVELAPDLAAPGAGVPGVPPRQSLKLRLLPPTTNDDANSILLAQIQNRLAGLPQLSHTTVDWVPDQTWTEARISPTLRQELRPPFAILNNRKRG